VNINRLDNGGLWLNGLSEFEAELYGPNVLAFHASVCEVGACANPSDSFIHSCFSHIVRSMYRLRDYSVGVFSDACDLVWLLGYHLAPFLSIEKCSHERHTIRYLFVGA
jgi:hypothetical protein